MFRAKIDQHGFYRGIEAVEVLTSDDIEVPEDCSLKPGAYRWNSEHGRFDPVHSRAQKILPDTPSLEEAMYALIRTLPEPPAECAAWAAYYQTTMDRGHKR